MPQFRQEVRKGASPVLPGVAKTEHHRQRFSCSQIALFQAAQTDTCLATHTTTSTATLPEGGAKNAKGPPHAAGPAVRKPRTSCIKWAKLLTGKSCFRKFPRVAGWATSARLRTKASRSSWSLRMQVRTLAGKPPPYSASFSDGAAYCWQLLRPQ